jgi:hypothetical protein
MFYEEEEREVDYIRRKLVQVLAESRFVNQTQLILFCLDTPKNSWAIFIKSDVKSFNFLFQVQTHEKDDQQFADFEMDASAVVKYSL